MPLFKKGEPLTIRDFGRTSFVTHTTGLKERIKEKQMRQYRGLTIDGKWVYGWYLYRNCVPNDTHYIAERAGLYHEVIPKTVGQYTGLKDKNGKEGKEIYKGDLLGSCFFSAALIVDQITEGCNCGQWIAKQKDGGYQDLYEALTADSYEVIGNIHQNPELMEQGNGK